MFSIPTEILDMGNRCMLTSTACEVPVWVWKCVWVPVLRIEQSEFLITSSNILPRLSVRGSPKIGCWALMSPTRIYGVNVYDILWSKGFFQFVNTELWMVLITYGTLYLVKFAVICAYYSGVSIIWHWFSSLSMTVSPPSFLSIIFFGSPCRSFLRSS